MFAYDSFGDYLHTVQALDAIALLVGLGWWFKDGRPSDPTADDFPHKGLLIFVLAWLFWVVLLVIDLVYSIVVRDWLSAAVDALLLLWVWWEFFGGKNHWKKFKKRVKERVAVIKGRLRVVPVPVPA